MSGLENGDGLDDEFDITISSDGQLPVFGSNYVQIGSSLNNQTSTTISASNSNNSQGVIGTSGNYGLGGQGIIGTGSSSGGIYVGGGTTTAPSNNWIWQQQPYITTTGTGSISISSTPNNNDKYAVFDLPRNKIPEAVYVSGRMVTMGFLGTDAECAFVGDKLIFSPGVLSQVRYNEKITLILQYASTMYHYKVHHNFGLVEMLPESNMVKTTLLSEIKREKNVQAR